MEESGGEWLDWNVIIIVMNYERKNAYIWPKCYFKA